MSPVAPIALSERVCAWVAALGGCAVGVCLLGVWADPVRVPVGHDHDHGPGAPVQVFTPPPSALAAASAPPVSAPVALPTPVIEIALAEVVPVVPVTAAPALVSMVAPVAPTSPRRVVAAAVLPAAAPSAERFTTNMPGDFPEPPYPRWARQQGLQGNLLVLVEVSTAGAPQSVMVRESCGSSALDAHAVEWVRQRWTWVPGAPRRFLVPFVFELQ